MMTTPRNETSPAAKSAPAKQSPPVRGGSTSSILLSLSASAAALTEAKKLLTVSEVAPLTAKSVLLEASFASLRFAVNNLELASNSLSIKIDADKSLLPQNNATKTLERDFAPFRSESADLYASYRSLKEGLNTFRAQFMTSLAEIQNDIANGKTQPSQIDPQFSGLSRTVSDKQKELAKLNLNDSHLVGRMQLVAKQVDFQVTAVKSAVTAPQESPQFGG